MLYRFTSRATTDLTMHQADGEAVLRLLGKPLTRQGIVTLEQLPAAIAALEAAVRTDRANTPVEPEEDGEGDADIGVSLAQRLVPLLGLLRLAQQAQMAVVWGV